MPSKLQIGFTLVEMAIVMFIIALMLGGGLTLYSTQDDQRKTDDTNALLSNAQEALIGYALSQTPPYLPCPDAPPGFAVSGINVANNGIEDRNAGTGVCDTQEGNLPWVTLGLTPPTDAWSNRLRYRVTAAFSNNTGMSLTSTGNINVRDDASANVIASGIPALILSHGKNGLGAINAAGLINPAPPAISPDERANADSTVNFVSHSLTPDGAVSQSGAAVGYFDDQLVWLSQYTLFNRMVQAGKLP
jgi:prepilin-type N-terminal cleavage/methylation domain-containing protein